MVSLILPQNDSNKVPFVYIARDEFDVTTLDGTAAFLRSMYNFKDVVMDTDDMWNAEKEQLCVDLFESLAELPSLSKQSKQSKPSKTSRNATSATLPSIAEHANTLTRQGYRIYKHSTTVCAF